MTLVLDTSILIDLERKNSETINKLKNFIEIHQSPAKITFINEFEFLFGVKEKNIKNKEKSISFLYNFDILPTTGKTATILSNLKYKYDKNGIAISLADLLIASMVIENNFVFLTKDKDFEKITELNKIIL
ncbi:type II toxin-antitoxin system VapC family toxin [Candidatus Woesearchaeota archaeon]|nr:type II toxin-antitoxin system VapC family toxin [Candidatus Woesearchaeota archaeon]